MLMSREALALHAGGSNTLAECTLAVSLVSNFPSTISMPSMIASLRPWGWRWSKLRNTSAEVKYPNTEKDLVRNTQFSRHTVL